MLPKQWSIPWVAPPEQDTGAGGMNIDKLLTRLYR